MPKEYMNLASLMTQKWVHLTKYVREPEPAAEVWQAVMSY
jgi:adenosine deaminase